MQIAADRKAGGLPPPSKGGAAGHRESATPLMFSAPLRVLRGQKAVLRAPPCLSVDQLVLFITTFKREESSDEKIDTTVIPEICDKHRAKTTNCRICQHFTGPHAEKARREATQGQAHTTGRTRAVLSAIPGMRVPQATSPSMAFSLPPAFLARKESRSDRGFRSFFISLSSSAYSPDPVTHYEDEVNNQSNVRCNK